MRHIEHRWFSTDGLHLFGQFWAPDGDPSAVVCLVHGLGEHSGRFGFVGEKLAAAGYALFGCDLRGHGRSGGKRGHSPSLNQSLEDIATLLDQAAAIFPHKPLFLYGHSLGGGLVINYALRRHPSLAGIIATSPSLRQTTGTPAWKTLLGRVMSVLAPEFSLDNGLDVQEISRDERVVAAYQQDPLVHGKISARMGIDLIDSGRWALENAAGLDLPLLLIHGSADRITSPEASRAFASLAPARTSLHILDGCRHETHNEPEKETMISIVIDWLDRQTAGIPQVARATERNPVDWQSSTAGNRPEILDSTSGSPGDP